METKYTTIKIKKSEFEKFKAHYLRFEIPNSGDYVVFAALVGKTKITVYSSTKDPNNYKVFFTGVAIENEVDKWSRSHVINTNNQAKKSITSKGFIFYGPQYGSDEVGFGDFFGPLVVVACYLDQESYQKLSDFVITDSKKLTDDYIRLTVPLLINRVPHKVNIVDNTKFNSLTKKGYNMNKIKAMLHVNVLKLLKNEVNIAATCYIDQFASYENFAKYIDGMDPIKDLVMKEKGESLYPSVALASILARYYFLKEMDALSAQFKTSIPLGASSRVDEFALEFQKKHGKSALDKIVKQNFINYQRLPT
ncbi:MAG TPA: ribonuclease HIII [Bacilli bacterium]|nr:ribonuclease HIII [Bacilli bacterium]